MTIGAFVGGRYASTLAASDLGITQEGYQLIITAKGELINQSDAYGGTLLDFFFQGMDVSCVFDSLEWKTGSQAALFPWGTLGAMGVIARLASGMSGAHVLTVTSGTPAVNNINTLTAGRAIMDPGFAASIVFTSKLRRVPIRFDYLPSDGAVHFTTT